MSFSRISVIQMEEPHTNRRILRKHPFYNCQQQSVSTCNTTITIQSYTFTSLANVYTPLLAAYDALAPTSSAYLTPTLIKFLAKAVLRYRLNYSTCEELRKEFYHQGVSKEIRDQIQRILKDLDAMSSEKLERIQLNLKQFIKPQWRLDAEPVYSAQEMQINRYKLLILEGYEIIPRRVKIDSLKQLASRLNGYFHTELVLDETKREVTIRIKKPFSTRRIVTLEQYWLDKKLNQDKRLLLVSEEQIEKGYYKIFKEMIEYNRAIDNFLPNSHYKPHPSNILLHLGTQTPFFQEVGEEVFSIDLMPLFMDKLGLRKRPYTIEQMIAFGKTLAPCLYRYDFKPALKEVDQTSKLLNTTRIEQIDSILCWLLVVDFILKKLLKLEGESCLQGSDDQFLEATDLLRQMQQNPTNIFDIDTIMLIELFEIDNRDSNGFINFEYLKWLQFLSEDKEDNGQQTQIEQYLQRNKFASCKLILQAMNHLLLDEDILKSTIEKNRLLMPIENVGRYIFIYILAKYSQLTLEMNILSGTYRQQDITEEKYSLKKDIDKLRILQHKIENKIDNDYMKRRNTDFNKKFMEKNKNWMMELYSSLKAQDIEDICGLKTGTTVKTHAIMISKAKELRVKTQDYSWRLLYYEDQAPNHQPSSTQRLNLKGQAAKLQNRRQLQRKKKKHINEARNVVTEQYCSFLKFQLYLLIFFTYSIDTYSRMKQLEAQIAEVAQGWQKANTIRMDEQHKLILEKIEEIRQDTNLE